MCIVHQPFFLYSEYLIMQQSSIIYFNAVLSIFSMYVLQSVITHNDTPFCDIQYFYTVFLKFQLSRPYI